MSIGELESSDDEISQQGLTVNYVGEAQQDENAIASIMKGEVQLIYMSPESLLCNLRIRRIFYIKRI